MNYLITAVITFCTFLSMQAQSSIAGLWRSEDSLRIYSIENNHSAEYNARLAYTSRPNEKPGAIILKHLRYQSKRSFYKGFIYSVYNNEPVVKAKVRLSKDGQVLYLKLSRMLLFPVNIKWFRLPLQG